MHNVLLLRQVSPHHGMSNLQHIQVHHVQHQDHQIRYIKGLEVSSATSYQEVVVNPVSCHYLPYLFTS